MKICIEGLRLIRPVGINENCGMPPAAYRARSTNRRNQLDLHPLSDLSQRCRTGWGHILVIKSQVMRPVMKIIEFGNSAAA